MKLRTTSGTQHGRLVAGAVGNIVLLSTGHRDLWDNDVFALTFDGRQETNLQSVSNMRWR